MCSSSTVVDPSPAGARRTSTSEARPGIGHAVDPGHPEPVRSVAVEDLAAGVALQLVSATDAVVAADRQEPAADPLGRRQRVPDVLDRRVDRCAGCGRPGLRRRRAGRCRPTRWMASISRTMSIIDGFLLRLCWCSRRRGAVRACRARARSRASRGAGPRSGGTGRATRRPRAAAPRRRRRAAGRRPAGRVAKPLSRRTLRCCETAGCEIPNSAWTIAVIAPEASSPSVSSSRIRRRTGSPRTSNACIAAILEGATYISQGCIQAGVCSGRS